jgi:hypothetical protein
MCLKPLKMLRFSTRLHGKFFGDYPVDLDIAEKLGISVNSSTPNGAPLIKPSVPLASLGYREFALRGLVLVTDA